MSYKHVGGSFSADGVRGVRRSIARMAPTFSLACCHCNVLNVTFKMELSAKRLQSIFGRKRNNRSTCHLFSQDTDMTSRSVSNRFDVNQQARCWSFFKVPLRWFFAHHPKLWRLSLICYVCFASLWFAVRLCVIQLYAHALCQQNHYYRCCRCPRIMTGNWGFTTSAPPEMGCVAVERHF